MSARKKQSVVEEMKATLRQRLEQLEKNERDLLEYVKNVSLETSAVVKELLQETDKRKFLKRYQHASTKLDTSLSTLLLMKAHLPSLDTDESSTDSADPTANSEPSRTQQKVEGSVGESIHRVENPSDGVKRNTGSSDHCGAACSSVTEEKQGTELVKDGHKEDNNTVASAENSGGLKPQPRERDSGSDRSVASVRGVPREMVKDVSSLAKDTSSVANSSPADTVPRETGKDTSSSANLSSVDRLPKEKDATSASGTEKTAGPSSSGNADTPNTPHSSGIPGSGAAASVSVKSQVNVDSTPVPAPHVRGIPPLVLPEGVKIEVVISEVVSPSIFWVQPVQSKIESLMQDISNYYSKATKIPAITPKVGMYCCACFTQDDCWYRARIVGVHQGPASVTDGSKVKIRVMVDVVYLDYGNREQISASRLLPLHPRFMNIPAQAACCRLAKVKPKYGPQWSDEETHFFTDVTQVALSKHLIAVVIGQPGSSNTLPAIDLAFDHYINEKEVRIVDVAQLMVEQHKAAFLDTSSCDTATTDAGHTPTNPTSDSERSWSPNQPEDPKEKSPQEKAVHQSQNSKNEAQDRSSDKTGMAKPCEVKGDDTLDKRTESETTSSGRKKRVRRRKARKTPEPDLSTEDTDVPREKMSMVRVDGRGNAVAAVKAESLSETPEYDSEISRDERTLSTRTPETSCTETESKQEVITLQQVQRSVACPVVVESGDQPVGRREATEDMESCGSNSPRSYSPNSTSGVSSAMSASYPMPKSKSESDNVLGSGDALRKQEGSHEFVGNSERAWRSGSIGGKFSNGRIISERVGRSSQESAVPSVEDDRSTDFTDRYYTCAEDASETESTDKNACLVKTEMQMAPSVPVRPEPLIKEIGKKLVQQRLLRKDEQIQFAMSHIASPEEFYIHLITADAKKMDYLLDELNMHYEGIEVVGTCEQPLKWPVVGDVCCAKFYLDNKWYRSEVLDIRPCQSRRSDWWEGQGSSRARREIFVKYLDFGNEEWIPEGLIYPLEKYFCDLPPMAFRCSMARLLPPEISGNDEETATPNSEGNSKTKWPQKCTEGLERLSGFEKLLIGHVINEARNKSDAVKLVVLDNSNEGETCINQKMVNLGLASSTYYTRETPAVDDTHPSSVEDGEVVQMDTSPVTTSEELLPSQESAETPLRPPEEQTVDIPDNWNPMMQHFASEANSYGVDMDDPGVATTGMKSTIGERVCKYYASGRQCYKGDNCPFEHPRAGREHVEITETLWCSNTIDMPHENEWVAMEITAIHNPIHFWVQLPYGPNPLDKVQDQWLAFNVPGEQKEEGETLSMLIKSINDIYSKPYSRHEDLSLLALGEIVCAQFTKDSKWYRARVTDVNAEANSIEVFYLDFGNSEWLPRKRVRPALPQFLHLPFQAVECFLAGVELVPLSLQQGEMDPARKLFEEITVNKTLVGHIIASGGSTLQVELFDTIRDNQVIISKALVDAGFAHYTSSKPASSFAVEADHQRQASESRGTPSGSDRGDKTDAESEKTRMGRYAMYNMLPG